MNNRKNIITSIKKIVMLCDTTEGEREISFVFENNVTGEVSYLKANDFECPDIKIMITGKLKQVEVSK